jgi:enediyne biosynthesis protein E4
MNQIPAFVARPATRCAAQFARLACAALIVLIVAGCAQQSPPAGAPAVKPAAPVAASPPSAAVPAENPVVDAGPLRFQLLKPAESGVDFTYYGNPSSEHYMTEQNGGGAALFDFDGDGWTDLFLVNGSHFDHPAAGIGATHRLYRHSGRPAPLHFDDVTAAGGLGVSGFGMGTVAGDFDNDGFPDLCICYYGEIQLWKNLGDGTFENVTALSGVRDDSWASSAAYADLDDDGDLDLYVANYVVYSPQDGACFTQHQPPVKISCGPIGRQGQHDQLWENRGDGTFAEVSAKSGIQSVEPGKGLAVEIVDLDGDGLLDIFVANDTSENLLFRNRGQLQYEEVGRKSGVAVGDDGKPASSMGIACADFDNNGWFDLYVTNFENSINNFYDNLFDGIFVQRSAEAGLATPSRPMLAFGTVAADFDLDGFPDLFVANGHIWDLSVLKSGHWYEMPPQLFHNQGGRRFSDVSLGGGGDYFSRRWLGRAAATADLDRDGAADLVVTHELQPAAILRNESPRQGASSLLRVIGTSAAREPLGIRIVYRTGGETRLTHLPAGGSFAVGHDPRVILSCPKGQLIEEITVHWRPGRSQTWRDLPGDKELTLIEGKPAATIVDRPLP